MDKILISVIAFEIVSIILETLLLIQHAQMVKNMNVTARVCNVLINKERLDILKDMEDENDN